MLDAARSFELIAQHAPIHIVVTDKDATILYANPMVERITGYPHSELIGANPRLWGKQMSQEFYTTLWKTIKIDKRIYEGQIVNRRKNGELYTAELRCAPILDNNGDVEGFVGIEIDITERQRLQQKLETSEANLLEAERVASIGNWVYEAETKRITWSQGTFRLLGFDIATGEPAHAEFVNHIHPDDRGDYLKTIDGCLAGGGQCTDEYRIVLPDGTYRWIRTIVRPIVDHAGKVTRLFGTVMDIDSDRKTAESLKQKSDDMERMNRLLTGRELRMIELKDELSACQRLLKEHGVG